MNPTQKQFSLKRAASKKQIPISKRMRRLPVLALFLALVFLQSLVCADILSKCGDPHARPNPLFAEAAGLVQTLQQENPKVAAEIETAWGTLSRTQARLYADAQSLDADCATLKVSTDLMTVHLQQFTARCTGQNLDEQTRSDCLRDRPGLVAELAARESEFAKFTAREKTFFSAGEVWEKDLGNFMERVRKLRASSFTGKKVYRLTAKSWIDGSTMREFTLMKWKLKLSTNDEPLSPELTDRFDYKLYQTFTAEVRFKNGKITSAVIVPNSADQRANTTFRVPGAAKVIQEEVVIAHDGSSADFRRTIEGRPNLVILIPDVTLLGNLKPIDNTLRLHVTVEGATPKGEGSAFPSHKFWVREGSTERPLDPLGQVQPSEYFQYNSKEAK